MSEEENKALETTINKHYGACGCSQGKVTGIITFIAYILLISTGFLSIYNI